MRPWRTSYVSRMAVPARALLQRFGFVVLLAAAFTMMILDKADLAAVERARAAVADLMTPILAALSRPIESVRSVVDEVDGMFALHGENAQLREANARLLRWEAAARRLEQENAALRGLLNFSPAPPAAFVSARVLADSGSAFVRTTLVNAGASDGVVKGQAVIDGAGLVGRIVEVGRGSSRVLMITDLNSRIPVIVESTRLRAILAGDNSDTAFLDLLAHNANVEVGARIVTSGHGGLLPAGLPVGVVTSAEDNDVRVQPLVDFGRLEYVRVVHWTTPEFKPLSTPTSAIPILAAPLSSDAGATETGAAETDAAEIDAARPAPESHSGQ